MYLASVAAEQTFVEVQIVPGGLLDRNQSYHRDLHKAVVGFEPAKTFAEVVAAAETVAVAGDVDFVGDFDIAAAAEAAEAADVVGLSERYWLAAMGAGL